MSFRSAVTTATLLSDAEEDDSVDEIVGQSRGTSPQLQNPTRDLMDAVKRQDIRAISRIMSSKDQSIMTKPHGKDGLSPLEVACERGYLSVLQTLLKKCKAIAAPPVTSLLISAARSGNMDVMRWLLSITDGPKGSRAGCSSTAWLVKSCVNVPDEAGMRPVLAACQRGGARRLEMVRLLVEEAGAAVDVWDKDGTTPLHSVVASYASDIDYDLVKLLLDRGARANAQTFNAVVDPANSTMIQGGSTPAHIICGKGSSSCTIKVAKLLVSTGGANLALQDHTGKTPLHLAVIEQANNLDMVRWLLQTDATAVNALDVDQETPLHKACQCDDISLFRLLVEYGGDEYIANRCGETPIERIATADIKLALRQDQLPDLKSIGSSLCRYSSLKQYGGDTGTILHAACLGNRMETVRFLLETREIGMDITKTDSYRRSALFYAPNQSAVQLFLQHGLSVHERDIYNHTPLHLCCEDGRYDAAKALLEAGAAINVQNNAGMTPFHLLSVNGYFEMARLLWSFHDNRSGWYTKKKNVLDVQRAGDGQTPLHTLCANICCWDGPCSKNNDAVYRSNLSLGSTNRYDEDSQDDDDEMSHWTPPFVLRAQHKARLDMLRWMVKICGADTRTVKDDKGQLPLSLVCQHCRDEVDPILRDDDER